LTTIWVSGQWDGLVRPPSKYRVSIGPRNHGFRRLSHGLFVCFAYHHLGSGSGLLNFYFAVRTRHPATYSCFCFLHGQTHYQLSYFIVLHRHYIVIFRLKIVNRNTQCPKWTVDRIIHDSVRCGNRHLNSQTLQNSFAYVITARCLSSVSFSRSCIIYSFLISRVILEVYNEGIDMYSISCALRHGTQ